MSMINKMSWKEAATLILTSLKNKPYASLFNYSMLMLKRSDKSSFMPNGYVFPGGTVEPADSNPKWIHIFEKFNVPTQIEVQACDLPPIFQNSNEAIPREVSLRITAIRETFEETGVLLCRKGPNNDCLWATTLSDDVTAWRQLVQKDANKFLELCENMNCYPDILALKLWSNWLTPPDFKKRFDTVFYTACLPEQPLSAADLTEVQELEWCSPENLHRASMQKKIWLPPPQFYELSRIMLFHMLEDLAEFAGKREVRGCERFGTNRLRTKEGLIFPMPGDDFYHIVESGQLADETFAFARSPCKKMHRLEIYKDGLCNVVVSGVTPTHGHILPVTLVKPNACCQL